MTLSSFSRFVAVSSRCSLFKTVQCFFSSEEIINNDTEGKEELKEPFMKEISRATLSLRVDTTAKTHSVSKLETPLYTNVHKSYSSL